MKVYVGTRFPMWKAAKAMHAALEDAGHEPTSSWVAIAERLDGRCDAVPAGDPERVANAVLDRNDVGRSDAIILLVPSFGGTGMWFEAGLATGLGKRVIYVGDGLRRTVFAELGEVYSCAAAAIAALASDTRTGRSALGSIADELARARRSHRGSFASAHEGFAVLLEEVEELKAEVFKGGTQKRSLSRMRQEATQVGAMAARFLVDLCGAS